MQTSFSSVPRPARKHPRTMGWLGTTALAMGGSNQMVFLIGALLVGQGTIPGQGTAAIPLLVVGLILSWMAAPGWTELILMWPDRVGGIAATCGEAFRPYAPVLGNLTGIAYWWGWIPTCGVCALLSAGAIQSWLMPHVPVQLIACLIIAFFAVVNLCGVKWIMRLTLPIGFASAALAFLSAVIPIWAGTVDWHQSFHFDLVIPFPGWFGRVTSAMAGLYLVGFAAPAFEAAACHVGETKDPEKNIPRAMLASAVMATLYFAILPVIWLGTIGSSNMAGDLATTLGPTYAPLFGGLARAAAAGFMMFNMFHGTIAPLTGVCRTLSQLSEDGLLPEFFAKRITRTDAPWVAISLTAVLAMGGVLLNDPVWFIAAANLTYLIGIALPNIAVWLLRRDMPDHPRPYRAPRGTIMAGVISAIIWGIATILGFEQFGLPVVIFGLALAYSGSLLYAWRKWADHRKTGSRGVPHSLHVKLTGAMMAVLLLDGAGYLLAVHNAGTEGAMAAALADIFVVVALLTITVGLILPGMVAHSAVDLANAARHLATTTLADFSKAMEALAAGRLEEAHARVDIHPIVVHSKDEVGQMSVSFNLMQDEVKRAAVGLDGAREGLRQARRELEEINADLESRVKERTIELEAAHKKLVDAAWHAGMAEVAIGVLHNVGNVLNSVNVSTSLIDTRLKKSRVSGLAKAAGMLREHEGDMSTFLSADTKGRQLPTYLLKLSDAMAEEHKEITDELQTLARNVDHIKQIVSTQQTYASSTVRVTDPVSLAELTEDAIKINLASLDRHQVVVERNYDDNVPHPRVDRHKVLQILVNLLGNAKWAIGAGGGDQRLIRIHVSGTESGARVEVSDTGIGIAAADLSRIFEHGFTRREGGHGFGLHSAAIAANAMGGSLLATSAGLNHGATFVLDIPVEKAALIC